MALAAKQMEEHIPLHVIYPYVLLNSRLTIKFAGLNKETSAELEQWNAYFFNKTATMFHNTLILNGCINSLVDLRLYKTLKLFQCHKLIRVDSPPINTPELVKLIKPYGRALLTDLAYEKKEHGRFAIFIMHHISSVSRRRSIVKHVVTMFNLFEFLVYFASQFGISECRFIPIQCIRYWRREAQLILHDWNEVMRLFLYPGQIGMVQESARQAIVVSNKCIKMRPTTLTHMKLVTCGA